MAFVTKSAVQAFPNVSTGTFNSNSATAGNLLICCLAWDAGVAFTNMPSLDPASEALGWLVATNQPGQLAAHAVWWTGCSIFYLPNCPAGVNHVITNFLAGSRFNGFIAEFSGYNTVDPLDQNAINQISSGTTITVTSGTTTEAVELVIVGCASNFVLNATLGISDPPSGAAYTSLKVLQTTTTYAGFEFAFLEVTSTGAQTATWSWTGGAGEASSAVATFGTGVTDTLFAQAIY